MRKTVWLQIAWFGLLILACYATVLRTLVMNWAQNPDLGHGFFVPIVSALIIWQRKDELAALKTRPCWWGLAMVIFGAILVTVATLGVEVFLARAAFVVTVAGAVWFLGGTPIAKRVAFPLALLLFMIPIPEIIYNRITFPLQTVASVFAETVFDVLNVPVLREGNVLELPNERLQVVEACSGIRSLLSLTFLAVVYAYFFEKRTGVRVALSLAAVPIAILTNGSRVALTGILSQIKPELAEGFFHESTGWVTFILALAMLIVFHQAIRYTLRWTRWRSPQKATT